MISFVTACIYLFMFGLLYDVKSPKRGFMMVRPSATSFQKLNIL